MALVGGETAEMPGFYKPGEYDLAGFCVGIAERKKMIDCSKVRAGDVVLGLDSTGLHSNGYSLARKALSATTRRGLERRVPGLGASVGEALLVPTAIYVKPLLALIQKVDVHGMAHITGGGLPGNLDRALPASLDAIVDTGSWTVPNAFRVLQQAGAVETAEMFRAFNMGVGMVVIAAASDVDAVIASAAKVGVRAWTLGRVAPGHGRVQLT
jgi:phosphoribosylformylglycinamidine cyclo-ligase